LPSRRPQLNAIPLLVGLVLGLDLLWALLGASTGSLAFGLVDEPAHLATCAVALLVIAALRDRTLPAAFVVAALLASVAIDLDHLPGYLGWHGLIGDAPRPYTHGLLSIFVLLGLGFLAKGRYRAAMLGLSFGVSIHVLRDLATGPGVPLGAPFSKAAAGIPYFLYALVLVGLLIAAVLAGGRAPRSRTRLAGQAGAAAVLLVALAATVVGPPEAAEAKGKQLPPAKNRVAVGIYLPGAERNPALIDAYSAGIGRAPAILHLYRTWSELPFDPAPLSEIWARGSMPMVTWEPWGEFEGTGIPLGEIAAGHRDAYIAEAARQAAAWGAPMFVRFAHEMNGGWYPWGANDPVVYKEAWRRVVGIFRQEGATNVKWVWCPYVDYGKLPFKRYYPGHEWVDWAGFDGFNWGQPYQSFGKIFDASYEKMVRLTRRPLMIPETGTIEGSPGSKASWIRRAFKRALPGYPNIRALVWFSDVHPRGMDWRVDTSASAFGALVTQMRAPRYAAEREFLLTTPTWIKKPRKR
jgi:membrane-bound metal-dependent hydrolase YbcI (DUF457 family)